MNESCVSKMAFVITLTKMFIKIDAPARNGLKGIDSGPCWKAMILKKDFRIALIISLKLLH